MDTQRAADFAALAVGRALARSGATEPLERVAVLTRLITWLVAERDRAARTAVATGDRHSALARALGVTRQAASKRYPRDDSRAA